jgi:hypothetical protein
MLFRPSAEADLDAVLGCVGAEPISTFGPDEYLKRFADRQYRREWTWVADDGGRVAGCAVWWGQPDSEQPGALDCLHIDESADDRIGVAAGLLTAGHQTFAEPPGYFLDLPNGWRDDPAVSGEVAWRRQAAARAGLTDELERLRFAWTPEAGLPASSGRLTFTAEPDDEVFVAALRRIAEHSLDVTTVKNLAAMGADAQARDDLDFYRGMLGERDWWRLARTADGELAGLAMPNRNVHGPVVGYLGVVPEQRGHHYIDDVLAEITRFHAEAGAERVSATTDTTNLPMAAAFERAGYRNYQTRLVFAAPPSA